MKNSGSAMAGVLQFFFSALICAAPLLAQTFNTVKSNTSENLRGLSAPSSKVFWASGTHGTYLRSTDGGNTWHTAQVPGAEALDFRDVEAFSGDFAYLLSAGPGDQSRIYKTTNGGKNWELQFTNKDPKGFFDCMAFWDRDRGIAIGDPVNGSFELIATDDGGKIWKATPARSLPPAIDGEGAFAASGSCIAVEGKTNVWFVTGGKAARVFRSTDAGKTWETADTPIIQGADSSGIFSVTFRDAKHGLIAGGDYKQAEKDGPNIASTEDGGVTWQLAPMSPQFYASQIMWGRATPPVQAEPGSAVFAVGSAHAAYAKSPTEKSWEKIWSVNLNSATYYARGKVIAVGPNGAIVIFQIVHHP
jgi:photosystem II stability/assembly factor-like uncharacterized protein